jgi:hypothetical protein
MLSDGLVASLLIVTDFFDGVQRVAFFHVLEKAVSFTPNHLHVIQ